MPTCLITATNRGIGFELALNALQNGWRVFGSVRTQDLAQATSKNLGKNFKPIVFDVTDEKSISTAAQSINEPIDLLINNAGVISPARQSTLDMDFTGFAKTLHVNTLAPLLISQLFLPHLRRSEKAVILTISSQMAWMGYRKSDRIAYRASKAAVNKVMQGLATDLEAESICFALIDPGWVQTDMGGPDADHHPSEIAAVIMSIANRLTIKETGKFFKWTGEQREF